MCENQVTNLLLFMSTTSGGPMRRPRRRARHALPFSTEIMDRFEAHSSELKHAHVARKEAVQLRSVVTDTSVVAAVDIRDTLGVPQPQDKWQGCTNLRTLRTLLSFVDDRGFERCAPNMLPTSIVRKLTLCVVALSSEHQMQFHSSFERCVSRVIYKADWGKDRPAIMRYNQWERCSSEVLIRCAFPLYPPSFLCSRRHSFFVRSTPRRFGKTFSLLTAC